MSKTDSLTAQGVIDIPNAIIFGMQLTSVIDPVAAPSGELVVVVRDDAAAGGTGSILARMVVSGDGLANQNASVTFPAGVRVTKGVAITVTNSLPDAHNNFLFICDYS